MRTSVLGLLLPLFLGCSGQNVVAGQDKTKAEQLEASVPSWCDSTCSRLLDCASTTPCQCNGDVCDCFGIDENCPTQCRASLAAFIKAGEACAAIGERLKKCIDRATCADVGHDDPCPLTAAERAACPDAGGSSDPPSGTGPNYGYAGSASAGDDTGSSSGGAVSYAGSANLPTAGSASSGGAGSTAGPPVNCSDSYAAGGGQPQDGSSHVTCEEGRGGCSGGHEYAWLCSEDSQGHRACSCSVDLQVTGAFALGADCPALTEVNAGCGWNLAQ